MCVFQQSAIESRVSMKFIAYCFDFLSLPLSLFLSLSLCCCFSCRFVFYRTPMSTSINFLFANKCIEPFVFFFLFHQFVHLNVCRVLSFPLMLKSLMLMIIHLSGLELLTFCRYLNSQCRRPGNLYNAS